MAEKLDLPDIGTLGNPITARAAINSNFTAIENAFDNTLSRDGTTPNQMEADIDMNGNDLLNVKRIDADEIYKDGVPFEQEIAYANKLYQLFSGTGAQTVFTLAEDPASLGNLYVSVAGADLKPGIDYTYSGTSLSFTVAPASGTNNIYVRYDRALPTGITDPDMVLYTPPSTSVSGTVKSFLDDLWDSGANTGASLLKFTPPDSSALAQALSAVLSNGVPVTWYATAAQLAVDATAATQAAINYAISSGRRGVYFPGGITYNFAAASAALDPGTGDMVFFGDGATSIIQFNEGSSTGAVADRKHLFRNTTNTAKGSLEFRSLNFKGTWTSGGFVERGGAAFLLDYYTEIKIINCRFYDFSWMVSACEAIGRATVIGCTFERSVRDMVRFRSSFNVNIVGNTFKNCDDDPIGLHQSDQLNTNGTVREGIVIASNIFEDTCGVRCLSGRMVTVRNNIFRRCKTGAILIYSDAALYTEGDVCMFGIDISGNQIYDTLARAPFSAAASSVIAVYSQGRKAGSSTSSVVPGENNTGTGAFVKPWDHRIAAHHDANASVAPAFFVRICDNTIARTLPAVAEYDDWGYGTAMTATGFSNAAVNDAALKPGIGIVIEGDARNVIVDRNIVSHVAECISFNAPTSHFGLDKCVVSRNVLSDYTTGGVIVATPGANRHINLRIADNDFDGDPYHTHANRGAGGTWLAAGNPYAVKADACGMWSLERNRIKNVAGIYKATLFAYVTVTDNVLRCFPVADNFSTSNKGIGDVQLAGTQFRYEMVDSDPTSASYGLQVSEVEVSKSAMPASGRYVRGTFVQAIGSTTIWGWLRLTTGTAHVAGTDWKTVALT